MWKVSFFAAYLVVTVWKRNERVNSLILHRPPNIVHGDTEKGMVDMGVLRFLTGDLEDVHDNKRPT